MSNSSVWRDKSVANSQWRGIWGCIWGSIWWCNKSSRNSGEEKRKNELLNETKQNKKCSLAIFIPFFTLTQSLLFQKSLCTIFSHFHNFLHFSKWKKKPNKKQKLQSYNSPICTYWLFIKLIRLINCLMVEILRSNILWLTPTSLFIQ